MAGPRYPLETLRKLRDDRADEQARILAAQVTRSQAAEAQLRSREAARREHGAQLAEARRGEQARLSEGATGADLARIAEFEVAARARGEALEQAVVAARSALGVERAKEQELRRELAHRETEAELLRRHESSFYEHLADQREKAEEDAALEQWSARRH